MLRRGLSRSSSSSSAEPGSRRLSRDACKHGASLAGEPWPRADAAYLVEDEVEIPVQINGKVKARLKVPADADKDAIETLARESDDVKAQTEGKNVVKVIVVPGRMVNLVVK